MSRLQRGLLLLFLAFSTGARADTILSFVGNIPSATTNGIVVPDSTAVDASSSFDLAGVSNISIQTLSFGGGVNDQGTVIPGSTGSGGIFTTVGGFAPDLVLFGGAGDIVLGFTAGVRSDCTTQANFDPVSGECGDTTLFVDSLAPGHYVIAITPIGNTPGLTLSDPFDTSRGSINGSGGEIRSPNFAFDVTITPEQSSPVPEPSTLLLLVSGFAASSLRGLRYRH
jgi:hypothetical protein